MNRGDWIVVLVAMTTAVSAHAGQTRMLFYGQLCTSPAMFGALYGIAEAPNTLSPRADVMGDLGYLWGLENVRAALTAGPWDYVLLEDANGFLPPSPEADAWLTANVRRWDEEIKLKAPTARTILMTQPMLTDYLQHTDHYAALYRNLADEIGALYTPVGEAFRLAYDDNPNYMLASGGSMTIPGRYLATLVWYNTITGKSPLNMPDLPGYSAADNAWLKDVATRTVAVPEPAAMVLLAAGMLGMARRPRA